MATLKANGKCLAKFVVRRIEPIERVGNHITELTYRFMESGKVLEKRAYSGGKYPHTKPYCVYGKLPKGTTGERFISMMKSVVESKRSYFPKNKYEIIKEEVFE